MAGKPSAAAEPVPFWYKDAVIYQLHIKAFFDANDDGMGDFPGLIQKLDYLAELGVTALWVLPFYPSPLRDDGYDIADYRDVHPLYGNLRDFRHFVREAHARGMRVITELVINHTSDQHPWFQRARKAKKGSRWRDYYVWSDTNHKYADTRIIFVDFETSNWTWDPTAQAYYWHRFYHHQPDLNFDNPMVFKEVQRVMKFWLDMGVDGLRLDAIPYLCEEEGTNNENLPQTHEVLRRMRAWLDANYPDRLFLAEANQWPEDVRPYFGQGDECHMAFHFPLMPRMYMALAQEDRHPITDILRQTPDIPESCQWAIFLRNHDELTLEMVSDRERDYLWHHYAADQRARINLGIRRRLAPLLEGDRRKIELLNSLLMSMPGTPVIYYGDEIGMGDNIFLGDRDGVRTPMQWSLDRNGGFSRADPARLFLPPIMDPVYGFSAVNVEAQTRNPSSLLNWMRRLIGVRKQHRSFGRGSVTFLYPGNRKVLALLRQFEGETILCVSNLSRAPQPVELDLSDFHGRVPVELMGRTPFPRIGALPYFITLPAYGFFWFLLADEKEAPHWQEQFVMPMPDIDTLVLSRGWSALTAGETPSILLNRILPDFISKQRWFAGKGKGIAAVRLADHAILPSGDMGTLMVLAEIELTDGERQHYQMPLGVAWESEAEDPFQALQPFALTRARRVNKIGALFDAMATEHFTAAVLESIRAQSDLALASGAEIRFRSTRFFRDHDFAFTGVIRRMSGEQSNTSMLVGDTMVFKLYRRVEPGPHPEIEVGRFLTDQAAYANAPALLGWMEMAEPDGSVTALGILQAFVRSQGDGWHFTQNYLTRVLEDLDMGQVEEGTVAHHPQHDAYLTLVETLGQRIGELHAAFATSRDGPRFTPEPWTEADSAALLQGIRQQMGTAHAALEPLRDAEDRVLAEPVAALLDRWPALNAFLDGGLPMAAGLQRTRVHGDLHLGQVVLAQNDFFVLDFEGEPMRPLAERGAKGCPLRDVAGMLRSFDYAAFTALLHYETLRPNTVDRAEVWIREWQASTVARFLKGYRAAAGGIPSVPDDDATFQRLLDLHILEKAGYEVVYEAENRPNWLRIPVLGLLRLAEAESP